MPVKVWPASEDAVKYIRHPMTRKFNDLNDGIDWPEDQFTFRRIADGDVTVDQPGAAKADDSKAQEPSDQGREPQPQPPPDGPQPAPPPKPRAR